MSDAAWLVECVIFHVSPSLHERAITARPIEFQPVLTVGWALDAMMDAPFAEEKIEIVQTGYVTGRLRRRVATLGRVYGSNYTRCSAQYAGSERDVEAFHVMVPNSAPTSGNASGCRDLHKST